MLNSVNATYRLQFNPDFGFDDARKLADYFHLLGISHVYASPVFRARKQSAHGYDIVDTTVLNPDLGSAESFDAMIGLLRDRGIGWIQDVVPNHMAYDRDNAMLMDVMENGPASRFFHFFDLFWNHPDESMNGRVLAPFLGRSYGEALENGEIRLAYDSDGFRVEYYGHRYPISIDTYPSILEHSIDSLKRRMESEYPDYVKYLGLLYVVKNLPAAGEPEHRLDQIAFVKKMLRELYTSNPVIKEHVDGAIRTFNGKKGSPETFAPLDALLARQNFRLSYWRVANQELNYKRFFNINELISIRVQDEAVFNATHVLIAGWIRNGRIDGLRIDHIDGLYDPVEYLQRLRSLSRDMYLVVEKILEYEERLPEDWPVQGTTGYDFLNHLNGLFCKKKKQKDFTRLYADFIGREIHFAELLYEKKKQIIGRQLTGDLDNLAYLLKRIANKYRHGRDITMNGLRNGMVEILACFPVYRTYIRSWEVNAEDRRIITETVQKAKSHAPAFESEIWLIEKFLLLDFFEELTADERRNCIDFVMKFQRLTGPLMAKGFEDTCLYIYNRLISLNEVGGDPASFGTSLHQFHNYCAGRIVANSPGMNATSTHDTKRSEDVRARINVLSEIPREWKMQLRRWETVNKKFKRIVGGAAAPDRNEEYMIYQTVIGVYPFDDATPEDLVPRLELYVEKMLREAKVHSFWSEPNTDYEDAVKAFVRDILAAGENNFFLKELIPFQKRIAHYGMLNSLSQTLVKLTAPGVPDFYQGTELWDLSLVDPDNRRPVDYGLRKKYLAEITDRGNSSGVFDYISELRSGATDGRIKMYLTYKALSARREHAAVFKRGGYAPLRVTGRHRDHVIAYVREHGDTAAAVLAPRWLTGLVGEAEFPLGRNVWNDTAVYLPAPAGRVWGNSLTGETIPRGGRVFVADILTHFPTALLISREVI
jgi:(1->4)-alpha-D-glucan 1-alpha-D-glucosylmutase